MNKNLSLRQVLYIFIVVLAIIFVMAYLAYDRLVALVELNENINRNTEFVLKLEEVTSYLKDAETGSRGYLLTCDTGYLQPQKDAGTKVINNLLELRQNAKKIASQLPYIDSLLRMSKRKIDISWDIILSIKPGLQTPVTEKQTALVTEGKVVMDSIRNTVAHLKQMEQERLRISQATQTQFAKSSPRFLMIIIVLAIAIIVSTMYIIYNQLLIQDKTQRNLQEKIKQLDLANQDLDQYTFTLSHHLQEPLRKIGMFTSRYESKLKKLPTTEGVEEDVKNIQKISALAAEAQYLLDEFLSFARLNKKNKKERESIDLQEVISNIWDDKKEMVTRLNATYSFKGDGSLKADRDNMTLLFGHLMDNALKFSHPDRHPIIEIESNELVIENSLFRVIRFTDNGIGFEQEYAQKIFTLFQRLNNKNANVGLGLGLAICRKIIESQNGTITAESKPGEGTLFLIKIPI